MEKFTDCIAIKQMNQLLGQHANLFDVESHLLEMQVWIIIY